ncbi:hypothetical protein V8E55_004350 [Tylopilus felleus]
MSVVSPSPSSSRMFVPERLAAPGPPLAQAFNGTASHHSRPGSLSLGKHTRDSYPMLPGPGGHTSPHSRKRPKVLQTSLDTARNSEVRDHMNKKMLDLARISRDDYVAKMQYQRLRMQELEMIWSVRLDKFAMICPIVRPI